MWSCCRHNAWPNSSVQFSLSVVSDSLQPHGLQPARLPCSSPTPGAYLCPSISDAIQPSHPLSSPSPHAFNLSQHQGFFLWVSFFASGGQRIGASASSSVLPMKIQGWLPLGLTGLISLQSKGLSRVFSNTRVQRHKFSGSQNSPLNNSFIKVSFTVSWTIYCPSSRNV